MPDEKYVISDLCFEKFENLEKRVDKVEELMMKSIEKLNSKIDRIIFIMISILASVVTSLVILVLKR